MVSRSFVDDDDKQQGCARIVCASNCSANLPSSINERCSQISRKSGKITRHAFGASPWKQMLPVQMAMAGTWLSVTSLSTGWTAARTKGSPATPQLQRQDRTLPWQKVLMPQEWHVVHWCLWMQRMCQSTQHCSHWGLPRWEWSVVYWPYSYLWIWLFSADLPLILQKWLVRHNFPCA